MDKKEYRVELDNCGHITIAVTDKVLDDMLSWDWQSMFYPLSDKDEALRMLAYWMHTWPPNWKGEHNLDGIANLTTDDLDVVEDHIEFSDLWDESVIEEITTLKE